MLGICRYILIASYLIASTISLEKITFAQLADVFIQTSRLMSKPYMWTRARMARLYSPFTPGQFGQRESVISELIYRAVLAETVWNMFPQTLIIGELAAAPRFLSYTLRDATQDEIKGDKEPVSHSHRTFTLMNMNICFLPAELPLLFGGVSSAAERVDNLTAFIKEHDPDVLCLYEAHEVDSTYALCEALKDNYAYFYVDIGPSWLELNSGLFVASKFAMTDVKFKPFQYLGMQSQINKGYVEFTIHDKERPLATIYSTHLQPYRKKCDINIRIQELQELVKEIQFAHNEIPYYPIVLCGDFNIPWGTEEYKRSKIDEFFYNDYGSKIKEVNEDTRTYSALLGDERWKNIDEKLLNGSGSNEYFEIIDYLLVFNKTDKMSVYTDRIEAFDTNFPDMALSDHHALFTTIYVGD